MADNDNELSEIRSALRDSGDSWTAGPTTISALPAEERRNRLGFTPPPDEPSIEELESALAAGRPQEAYIAAAAVGAPPSFDLRNVSGRSFVTPIKDQGGCGSCVAFGVAAVLESTLMVARKDPAMAADLSEAQLFYCYARAQGRNCSNGWWPDQALDACRTGGLAFEQSYPYVAGDQNCTKLAPSWRDRYVSVGGRQGPLRGAAIKEWIATRGPVTGCFIVYQDFFSYTGGVYRHVSGNQAGGHCVTIIGYDDAQSCWIAKNSWGTGWGEKGFFRIAYGECGIDTWAGPYGADKVALEERATSSWSNWASQGGGLTSDIAVGRNADGRLEVFARGTDNAMWHKWQTAPNNGWSGWASRGGVLTSNITVAQNADGRLEAFVRGTDNALWHNRQTSPGGSWSGWVSQGGVLTSNITVGRNADGRLELFVRGTDNALWHKWQTAPGGSWSGWASQGGVLTSDIAVGRNADGRMELFVRGTDNALWHKWQTAPNSGWAGWASQGGVLTSNITVGRNASGRMELFVRGTDNALWHKWQTAPNSGWSPWASQGGVLTSNIAVAQNADGRLEVFARGTDGALWHKWQGAPAIQPPADVMVGRDTRDTKVRGAVADHFQLTETAG